MKQFFAAKSDYPDLLLFFRMGDFYEMRARPRVCWISR